MIVQMAISRTREYAADNLGARISGRPDALASALVKIAHMAEAVPNDSAEAHPATAHLFITWAADLAIYDPKANDRERMDVQYMVGSKGHLVRFETRDGRPVLSASREGKVQLWPVEPLPETLYDRYVGDLEQDRPLECTAQDACRDIEILQAALASPGHRVPLAASS